MGRRYIAKWYGPDRRQETTYGEAALGWPNCPARGGGILEQLVRNPSHPAIARATALQLLHGYPGASAFETIHSQISAPEPLVRLAALNSLEMIPPERLAPLVDTHSE